jgi:hypothetical protein
VADFLAKVPNHVLLTEQFDVYPQLIFLNHNNNYGTGMDSRFIDLYDNTLSADVAAFWKFTPCETTHCTDTVVPPLSFYQHSITHVLVDANETTEAFVQQMNMSPAYRLVMTDSRHPEVQLYELLPQTP